MDVEKHINRQPGPSSTHDLELVREHLRYHTNRELQNIKNSLKYRSDMTKYQTLALQVANERLEVRKCCCQH